jgi:hypothetical protein
MQKFALLATVLALPALALSIAAGFAPEPPPTSATQEPATQEVDALDLELLRELARDIELEVEELRDLDFEREVTLHIATREDFLAYVDQQLATVGTPEELAALELAVQLLGLFPADRGLWEAQIELLGTQVGGYYDPVTESFSILATVPPAVARATLSHELVHALEDQHYDLDAGIAERRGNSDALAAYQALFEGSATVVQSRWMMENLADFTAEELRQLADAGGEELFSAEPVLWLPLLFAYLGGQQFLTAGADPLAPVATERLAAAYLAPPRSTEQVLHPEKYWDPKQVDEPQTVELTLRTPGFERLYEDVLGEVQLSLLARGSAAGRGAPTRLEFTDPAASGWDGDRAQLYARGDDRLLVVATVFDSAADREQWAAALELRRSELDAAAAAVARELGREHSAVHLVPRGEEAHLLLVAAGCTAEELAAVAAALLLTQHSTVPPAALPDGR